MVFPQGYMALLIVVGVQYKDLRMNTVWNIHVIILVTVER